MIFKHLIFSIIITVTLFTAHAQSFIHPGLLHSREDLDRMKKAVAEKQQPIFSGYQIFIQNPASQNSYKMQGPLPLVGRNPTIAQGAYDNDANAAHQNAIMWCITGDITYANKAKEILNAWCSTLKSITGRDAVLMAGLGPFKMLNAAEIIRYSNAGWSEADIQQAEKHFKEVVYPVLKNFAPFANGNWDAAAIKTVMSIGVFCNDRSIFERALRYYVNGSGNGRLSHYIINEDGQIQESGRDQGHTQLGIALLGDCSEIAWHQGLNLYEYNNNLLLKGFEYTAKYNLGNDVPFTHTLDHTGKYEHFKISTINRGELRAVYEQIYNHYVNRMGMSAPFTKQAAEKLRPEGPGKPGADHPGYGTLYYTRTPGKTTGYGTLSRPAPPGAITGSGTIASNKISWVASIGAQYYTVKRSVKHKGPYMVIAKNIKETNYSDKKVKSGIVYYYTVSASNAKGESADACETGISAGLPAPWKQQDIGAVTIPGQANFDGRQFTVEGSGTYTDSINDQLQFVYFPLDSVGEITVRFIPQPSSQFSKMGLMMRESLSAGSPQVCLLLNPGKSGQVEAPYWKVVQMSRGFTGKPLIVKNSGDALTEPVVTYGRLTGYCWLRLQRKFNSFYAYSSLDGKTWTSIGSTFVEMKRKFFGGIAVSSGLREITTTVTFDHVSIPGWNSDE